MSVDRCHPTAPNLQELPPTGPTSIRDVVPVDAGYSTATMVVLPASRGHHMSRRGGRFAPTSQPGRWSRESEPAVKATHHRRAPDDQTRQAFVVDSAARLTRSVTGKAGHPEARLVPRPPALELYMRTCV
jgi:hypothetical protein